MTIKLTRRSLATACSLMTMAYIAPIHAIALPSLGRQACVSDLTRVFDDPVRSDGRRLCAVAYLANEREFLGFYPTEDMARARSLDVALVLPTASRLAEQISKTLRPLDKVYLTGALRIDRECITPDPNPDLVTECLPVSRPVYLMDARVRLTR